MSTALVPTGDTTRIVPIYLPQAGKPMRVAVFASGGGGNLRAAIQLANDQPERLKVALVITDRPGIPAIAIADQAGVPALVYDFERQCGLWSECRQSPERRTAYRSAARKFHDGILDDILTHSAFQEGGIDLVALSYRRWIHGRLLHYFKNRMINQHPADLGVFRSDPSQRRAFTGINPVSQAIQAGVPATRTTTFLVNEGHDAGEILCQGPWVPVRNIEYSEDVVRAHEERQKKESDWPSLRFALSGIAAGDFGIVPGQVHGDGCRFLAYRGVPLPYTGVALT